jgi:hypothetical protein
MEFFYHTIVGLALLETNKTMSKDWIGIISGLIVFGNYLTQFLFVRKMWYISSP